MAASGLCGTAMAAPVVGYYAIAVAKEEQHLCVPVIGAQRPAVREHDWLPSAPVFVIDFSPVFCLDCAHLILSFRYKCERVRTHGCTRSHQCCPFYQVPSRYA